MLRFLDDAVQSGNFVLMKITAVCSSETFVLTRLHGVITQKTTIRTKITLQHNKYAI
jgi:hypothetical protein